MHVNLHKYVHVHVYLHVYVYMHLDMHLDMHNFVLVHVFSVLFEQVKWQHLLRCLFCAQYFSDFWDKPVLVMNQTHNGFVAHVCLGTWDDIRILVYKIQLIITGTWTFQEPRQNIKEIWGCLEPFGFLWASHFGQIPLDWFHWTDSIGLIPLDWFH